jgi:hypothetical protein
MQPTDFLAWDKVEKHSSFGKRETVHPLPWEGVTKFKIRRGEKLGEYADFEKVGLIRQQVEMHLLG